MEITTLRVDLISDLDITILRILLFLSFLFLQKLQFILDAISNTTTHPADIQTSTVELSHPLQKFAGWTIDS